MWHVRSARTRRLAWVVLAAGGLAGLALVTEVVARQAAADDVAVLDSEQEFMACTSAAAATESRALPSMTSRLSIADGTVRSIGDHTVAEYGVRVSHRGDRVAFCVIRSEQDADLHIESSVGVCDVDGRHRRTVYSAPKLATVMQLEWSSEDRYIALCQLPIHEVGAKPPADLVIGELVLIDVQRATGRVAARGSAPRWSADGTRLAFLARHRPSGIGEIEPSGLIVADWSAATGRLEGPAPVVAAGGRALQIGNADGYAWTGDSSYLAVGIEPSGIALVGLDGSARWIALKSSVVTDVACSPDGSFLAVACRRKGDRKNVGQIYRVDTATGTARPVARVPGEVNGMVFLADGATLVVTCFSTGPLGLPCGPEIWTMDMRSAATGQPFGRRIASVDDGSWTAIMIGGIVELGNLEARGEAAKRRRPEP